MVGCVPPVGKYLKDLMLCFTLHLALNPCDLDSRVEKLMTFLFFKLGGCMQYTTVSDLCPRGTYLLYSRPFCAMK